MFKAEREIMNCTTATAIEYIFTLTILFSVGGLGLCIPCNKVLKNIVPFSYVGVKEQSYGCEKGSILLH